jgi:hypothetical protein
MNKKEIREKIFNKFNGLCAYSGKPLDCDWQVDHVTPKCSVIWGQPKEIRLKLGVNYNLNDFDNLLPTIKIINHYKRSFDLEGFRTYMLGFHLRLAKLPKNTNVLKTKKRKEYMFKIAELFEITTEKPFGGKFYFEKLN